VSRFLLDAGPLAGYLLDRPGAVELIDPWLITAEAVTSIVVYGEAYEYILGHRWPDTFTRASRDLAQHVEPLEISLEAAARYGIIRRQLRPPDGPGLIGDIDTLIAATALESDLTVVTLDSHFYRVPDLKVLFLERATFRPILPAAN
jgi:predicted nucleic acid-binding protein